MKKVGWLLVAALLGGCQTGDLISDPLHPPGPTLMGMWGTYTHCRSTTDLEARAVDARDLNLAARHVMKLDPSPIPLPALLKRHVPEPTLRYSVDPNAMAASCGLLAGETALQNGHNDVAIEMFLLVLKHRGEPAYRYYLEQARIGLRRLEPTILVSDPNAQDLSPARLVSTTR